ncbi:hypothetical protein [uncultured Microbacterium sp.]|uniref:hypothetical protein n=1 Tax=uncultured Microbacterium sp. TaxID=191216 RepID=UPI0025DAB7D6|nr:hypothetical protein [uncultured Microbacterium sp.]
MTIRTLARHLAHVAVFALIALAVVFIVGAPAHADTGAATAGDGIPSIVWRLDVPQLLNLLIAVVFPVLVGLVTTSNVRSAWKAILLATISLASGLASALLTAVLDGVPFDLIAAFLTGLAAWIIALATYAGFWKPTGVAAAAQRAGVQSRR